MKTLGLLLVYLTSLLATAQDIDFTHLQLYVELDTNQSTVHGEVQLSFKAKGTVDSVYLNGVNMDFEKVLLNNAGVKFDSDNKGIWLWPEPVLDSNSISINYTAHPRRGMFFIGWNDETGLSRRQIWTQGQGVDNRHWVPHFDDQTDKLITEIEILFDSHYEVISNGVLLDKKDEGAKTHWHYKMKDPHSSYLMMVAIGKYDVNNTLSSSGILLSQYYYPDREGDYGWYYHKNEEIFNFLQKEIGVPYPWQNYKQVPVQDFQHGAMENTTATIFGDFFLVDGVAFNDRNYTYVNAHELAHQWFGNLITATGSDEHWLHEGFATYYQWLSERHLYGQEFFDWERYKAAQMVFEASKMDTVPLGNEKAGSARFYQKGAWVLDMLKNELGKENFDRVIRNYLKQYAFGLVTTDSLNASIEDVTSRNFKEFFERWVYTAGEPKFEIEAEEAGKGYKLIARPAYMPFKEISIPVEVIYSSRKESKKIWKQLRVKDVGESLLSIEGSHEGLKLQYWKVNPNMEVLIEVDETKPFAKLLLQYKSSSLLLDRFAAVSMANKVSLKEKEDWLITVMEDKEEFFSIRAEALKQLVQAACPKSEELLLLALRSKDVQLQKEAIALVESPGGELLNEVEKLRRGNSYELRELAMHKSIAAGEYDWLTDDFWMEDPGFPDHNIAITALLYRVAIFKDSLAINKLVDFTSSGNDFLTRIKAMNGLAALQYFNEEVVWHYFDALFSLNRTLARNARVQLKAGYEVEENRKAIESYIEMNGRHWDDFEKRTVNRTFGLNLE